MNLAQRVKTLRPKYLPPWNGDIPWDFEPREYQKRVWNYFLEKKYGGQGGKRATLVWHRRAGKDFFAFQWLVRCCMVRPGTYWHIFPNYAQGEKAIWKGRTKKKDGSAEWRYLDYIPIEVRNIKNGGDGVNNADLTVTFNPNLGGSIYSVVGADKPESLVGAGVSGVVYSEYDLMPRNTHSLIQPMLKEADGWAMFLYTPHGRNHGYDHWQRVRALPQEKHYSELLTVRDTLQWTGYDIDELIEEARSEGMSEEKIQSEYFCSFDAPQEGAIYGSLLLEMEKNDQIGKYPWNYEFPVNTAWDWGMDDHCVIWFFQIIGDNVYFIDYYRDHGKGVGEYAKVLREKAYTYGEHYVPWDMNVRESTGITRLENARKYQLNMTLNQRTSVLDKIEGGRVVLRHCKIDSELCKDGIADLRDYKREYDDKTSRFKDNPCHDYASHGADAFLEACKVVRFVRQRANKRLPSNYKKKPYSINI